MEVVWIIMPVCKSG